MQRWRWGEHTEVVGGIRPVLEEHPLRERLWGQLMLALYRSGRQAEALEAFGHARRVLGSRWGSSRGRAAAAAGDPGPRPALASVPTALAPRSGLPAPLTSFVGRQQALAEVAELVPDRLVTLIGPPGVGKSRLAMAASRAVEHEFVGGVWFVELARAARPADVPRGSRTLDARAAPTRDPLARVVACCRNAGWSLDGCEPVLAEAARVWPGVLAECPGVRVLATSREVLHLEGEVRFLVAPLPVPAAGSRLVSWRPRSRSSCFWSRPRLHGRDCRLPSTTSPWRRRFAAGWTGCHWGSNLLRRAPASSGCARSFQRSRVGGSLSTPETAGRSPALPAHGGSLEL